MATKTISIDLDAYARLKRVQRPDESFSQVIKRLIKRPDELLRVARDLGKDPISDEALDAVEKVVAARRRPAVTRPRKHAG